MALHKALTDLLADQSGVVARRQLLAERVAPAEIRRLLRRGDFVKVVRGVYVNHNGPLTWEQSAWAAVLLCWPAALAGESAIRAATRKLGRDDEPVHVAVAADRSGLRPPSWVRLHWRSDLDDAAQWNTSPPRLRYEEALLDQALASADDFALVATLARGVQERRTTAKRLAETAARRSRLPRRSFVLAVLDDLAEGACSVLEREYLVRVERAHGLPTGKRQRSARKTFRDVEYLPLVVELDGRLFHDNAEQHDLDLERDLDTALERQHTIRLGWGQVLRRTCRTTGRLVELMQRLGIEVDPHPCTPGCPVGAEQAA